jgi:hypothetical protein
VGRVRCPASARLTGDALYHILFAIDLFQFVAKKKKEKERKKS